MGWIDVAQDMSRWRVVVNAVMKLQVLKIMGISVTEDILRFQVGVCFM